MTIAESSRRSPDVKGEAGSGGGGGQRAERDSMGEVPVPAGARWGAQTQRAVERCLSYALSSPAIVTSLNPYIGYDQAAKVVKKALAERRDLRSVVLEMGLMSEDEVDKALDVLAMTRGGVVG